MTKLLSAFLFLFFVFPLSVSAQMVITEIMYSPEGADGGREWIEVKNSSGSSVDLGIWRLFENEANHYIRAVEEGGNTTLLAGGLAIIADNPVSFLADWPGFSGLLLDSAFSLVNTGETLVLRDGEIVDKDTVAYDAAWGADGDGNSLQFINGEWVAAPPTPGGENSTGEIVEPPPAENNPATPVVNVSAPSPASPLFTARISEKEKFAIVGAPAKFKGDTVGTTEGLSGKTRFMWNFGDGSTAEGQSVLHVYKYPGDYVVVLDAVSGTHAAEDRATIKVIPAELFITNVVAAQDFFIELSNNSAYELNLSGWLLKSGARYFVIPENSFILPKKKIIFSQEATGLSYSGENSVGLLYPNGLTAAVFSDAPNPLVSTPSVPIKKAEDTFVVAETIISQKTSPPPSSVSQNENPVFSAALPQGVSKQPATRDRTFPWLFGTLALVMLGGAGVILVRRGPPSQSASEGRSRTPSDEFAITEENDIV